MLKTEIEIHLESNTFCHVWNYAESNIKHSFRPSILTTLSSTEKILTSNHTTSALTWFLHFLLVTWSWMNVPWLLFPDFLSMPSLTRSSVKGSAYCSTFCKDIIVSFDNQSFKQLKWQICGLGTDLISQFNKHYFYFGVRFFFLTISLISDKLSHQVTGHLLVKL